VVKLDSCHADQRAAETAYQFADPPAGLCARKAAKYGGKAPKLAYDPSLVFRFLIVVRLSDD
jgi:hypothetical protein